MGTKIVRVIAIVLSVLMAGSAFFGVISALIR